MRQTLFNLPSELWGLPVFGVGLLLAVWTLLGVGVAVWLVRRQGWSKDTITQLVIFAISGAVLSFLPARWHLISEEGLPVRGYGVMLLLAVSSAVAVSVRRARQMGQDPEMIFSCATWLFIGGIAGARLFYVIEYWDRFQKATIGESIEAMLNVAQGGLVVYGALLAGGVALFLFVRMHRLPWLAMCDLVAPGLILGMAIGRLGCFLNGCCYGGISTLPYPLSVTFPWGTPPFVDQVQRGKLPIHGLSLGPASDKSPVIVAVKPDSPAANAGLKQGDTLASVNDVPVRTVEQAELALMSIDRPEMPISIHIVGQRQPHQWKETGPMERSRPVHPVQMYSTIDLLLLCGFLLAYSPFRRRDGELLALVLTMHPISRFLLELIRVDEADVMRTHMSIAQNISLLLLAAGALTWAYLLRRPAKLTWSGSPGSAVPA